MEGRVILKKIVILGSGGAGKSTLARQLNNILHIEVFHLDRFFWSEGWTKTPEDKWVMIQKELTRKDSWILDGNYMKTIDIRLAAADTIIFLDVPRIICIFRALKRIFEYRNRVRPDIAEGCQEKVDFEFLKWIWNYPSRERASIIQRLNSLSFDKEVIHLTSDTQTMSLLRELRSACAGKC